MTSTTIARPEVSVLPERFAVEVTDSDIVHGESCISDECPIALAIERWLRNQNVAFVSVNVTSSEVFISLNWRTPMQRYWYDATGFVSAFDRGEIVEPRTVVLARLP